MGQNPPTEKVVLMMAMALRDGAVVNDRLIVMISAVIDTVRKIPPGSCAVKTLYDQYAFQEFGLIRIIAPQ
jgi:carbonic anhydrase/acetyltransferase-like protein (isoleucine patch superfamily)